MNRPTRRGAALIAALLVAMAPGRLPAAEAEGGDLGPSSCGVKALYTLLRLEGRSVDPGRISALLPEPTPRGHSMKDLRDAARACGLGLVGVRVREGRPAMDRPILALVSHGEHGHYVVVRPVGHSGTLVQVLDPNRPPVVEDAAEVLASPEWTGLALVPRRPDWPARIAGLMALASGLILIAPRRPRAGRAG